MLSNNFQRSEFACKCCCGFAAVDVELLFVLEDLRKAFNKPVKINSGCRCEKRNYDQGGEPHSKHMLGIAADIQVDGVDSCQIADYLEAKYPKKYGIGRYKTWTHIDMRSIKARWSKIDGG
jgi:uncharacterized protein YcbK (DUF882 family)